MIIIIANHLKLFLIDFLFAVFSWNVTSLPAMIELYSAQFLAIEARWNSEILATKWDNILLIAEIGVASLFDRLISI